MFMAIFTIAMKWNRFFSIMNLIDEIWYIGLVRWLSGWALWLLFWRSRFQIPVTTRWLTTIHKSNEILLLGYLNRAGVYIYIYIYIWYNFSQLKGSLPQTNLTWVLAPWAYLGFWVKVGKDLTRREAEKQTGHKGVGSECNLSQREQ